MDANTRELRVFDLPPDVTEDQLMTIFRNKRGQGGGPIENIILENKTNSAIITFKDAEAVDLIMGRPSQVVNILGKDSRVERFFKAPETPVNKPCAEVHKKKKSKPKPPQEQTKPSDEPKPQKEMQTDLCENTVKMFVQDITKTKDFYLLYLEDESINSGPFIEESLLLDGHNKSVYVTFHHKKDAEKFCSVKHKPKDSNIQKVQLAEPADFNTYNNLLYIRGVNDDFDVERLRAVISEDCAMEVNDVIQQQDTRAAIFVFDSEECSDISELTWQCSRLQKEPYITGPVFQEFCVLVSDLKPETTPDLLRRYMSNKNRSGGGPVKSVSKLNPIQAVVAFDEEDDYEGVLSKTDHLLEGSAISVQRYYPCLNKEEIKSKKNQPNKPTAIAHPLPSRRTQNYRTENLSGQEVQLVTFYGVEKDNKKFVGRMQLIFEAYQYFIKHQDRMEQVARDAHCKMGLKPFRDKTQLNLWLDWPGRIKAHEVKQKLDQALTNIVHFLGRFKAVSFKIPADKIQDFQNFFKYPETSHYNICFHHVSFVALIIGEDTVSNLIALVNENYSQFLSQPMNHGAINYASPQSAQQSDHELPYANKNKPTDIPKETLPDKELTEVKDMPLKRDEFILIKKSNFFLPMREKYPNLKIEYDEKEFKVFFKGRDKTDVISACYESLKKCQDDLAKVKLENFSVEQNLLLKKATFLEKVNSSLHEGHLYFSPDGVLTLQYINTADKDKMIEQVKSQVDVRKIKVTKDLVLVLKSQLGANFLSGLCDQIDGVQMTACIQLDQAEENLVIISPQDQQYKLHKEVEEFLKKNQPDRKEIPFSYGKQQMLKRFMQKDHDKILNDKTAKVEKLADRFIVTGLKDSVYKLTEQLQELSLKITVQDIELKYFGIQEFLQNAEGKSLVKKVEDQNQCVILIKSEDVKATFGSPKTETKQVEPSVIARAEVYNVELVFLQGDITTIKADVIVNPLDSSLATSSALSRSLISRGPADLFKNLKQLSKGSLGTVIPTTCSKIPNLKAIFNVVCPVSIDDLDKLRLAVTNCLMECQKQNFSSIALPVIGIGQKFPVFTICARMMDALYDYLNGSPTLTHIYFCDVQPNHVEDLMDRFEATFDQCTLHHITESDEEKNITKYGAVTLVIEKRDITLEKCDGVVIGIKDSMDLNHSGQVCKALLKLCGQTLQDECSNKQIEMAKDGVVLTSAPNMSCQHILHVSQDKFAKHWDRGVTAVLAEADKAGLKSLAIPALGTGARNANIPLLSKMILGAIEDFGKSSPRSLTQIKLVIYDQYVLDEFLDQAQSKHWSHNTEGTTTKVSERVTLDCYSNHPYQIRMAKQSLLQECKASFKENSVRDENVKKLNTKQIEKLKSVGFENLVLVTVRQEAGIVLMQGFKVDGIVKVQKLLQKFLSIYVVHEKLHKSLLSAIEGEEWDDFELMSILTSKLKHKVKADSSLACATRLGMKLPTIPCHMPWNTGVESLPDQWTPMSTEESVKTVPLNHGCCEYKEIKQLFILGGANLPIKKIERIQNKFLYQQYSVKKRELDLVNPKGHKNELRLFHGTSAQSIPMIIHNGFNRSYCGMNGTVYGKGVYFAVNSSYSVGYAKPDAQGSRHMFVALVLVGESTPSNSSMNYLPIKPGTTRPYDSGCANGMYVIFHDTQCYPQYLITF